MCGAWGRELCGAALGGLEGAAPERFKPEGNGGFLMAQTTAPPLPSGYLCELKELSLPSTEVATDSWEAGRRASPSGPGEASGAGGLPGAGRPPLGCCVPCWGPLALCGLGPGAASSWVQPPALEGSEVSAL